MFKSFFDFINNYLYPKYYYSFSIYLPISHVLDNPINIHNIQLNDSYYSDSIVFDKKTNIVYFDVINTNDSDCDDKIIVKSISYSQEMYFPDLEKLVENNFLKFIYNNNSNYNISNITGFTFITNDNLSKKIFCPIEFSEYSRIDTTNKFKIIKNIENKLFDSNYEFVCITKIHFRIRDNKKNEFYESIEPIYLYKYDTLLCDFEIRIKITDEFDIIDNVKLVVNNPFYSTQEQFDDYELIDYNSSFYHAIHKKHFTENNDEISFIVRLPYKYINNIYLIDNNFKEIKDTKVYFRKIKKYDKLIISPEICLFKKQILTKSFI